MAKKKRIDYVTVDLLDVGLRGVGISIDKNTIDKIIDVVELIEDTKGKTTLRDISRLESYWNKY